LLAPPSQVSLVALCHHARRAARARPTLFASLQGPSLGPVAANGGVGAAYGGVDLSRLAGLANSLPPGHRLGVVAADGPSGRHVIIVPVPPGGGYAEMARAAQNLSAAARSRTLLPNGKVPTPAGVIANLPTYRFSAADPRQGGWDAGGGEKRQQQRQDQQQQQQQQEEEDQQRRRRQQQEEQEGPPPAAGGEPRPDAAAGGGGGGVDGGASSRAVCAVCLDPYEEGTLVKLLPCMHGFCAECIDAWLARDVHCPIWCAAPAGAGRRRARQGSAAAWGVIHSWSCYSEVALRANCAPVPPARRLRSSHRPPTPRPLAASVPRRLAGVTARSQVGPGRCRGPAAK
jgi:hypothetical protein